MNGLNEAYLHAVLADRHREAHDAYVRAEVRALARDRRRARTQALPGARLLRRLRLATR